MPSHLVALIVCLVLGGGLRFAGLTRGIGDFDPSGRSDHLQTFYNFHPDEETLIRAGLALESPFEPPLTAYGLLPLYVLRGALLPVGLVTDAPTLNMETTEGRIWIFLTLRVVAACCSSLILVLVYWLGRRCFDTWTALLATFMVSVAPVAVQQAHFYTIEGIFLLCSLAVFCALVKVLDSGEIGWVIVAGVCAGASAAVRLNGVLLVLVIAGVLWVRREERWLKNLWVSTGSAVLTLGLLEPYLLTRPALLWQSATSADLAYSLGIARGEILKPWTLFDVETVSYLHYWTELMPLSVGGAVTVFFAAGFCAGFRQREPLRLSLLAWLLISFLLVGGLHTKHVRYLLPMVPFLSLLAADFCLWLLRRAAGWRPIVGVAIAVGMLSAGWYGVAFARIYTQEDSRIQAGRWIFEQVPAQSVIGVEKGGFSLGALVDGARYVKEPLDLARLFNGRPYLSCRAAAHFLGQRLVELDYIAPVDANRYAQFSAAPRLYPAVASFYTRLFSDELGFAQVARFKRYPAWAGRIFVDDGVEPSFIGFDHPAVVVFKKRGDLAASLAQWERELDANPHCPDRTLNEIGRLLESRRYAAALGATGRLEQQYPYWQLPPLIRAWIYAQRGEEAPERAAITRYRAGFFAVEDAQYVPWASALSFAQAQMPDLALTALAEGALQVAEYPTPGPVRRAMADSYGEIAEVLQRQGRARHAQVAYELADEVRP